MTKVLVLMALLPTDFFIFIFYSFSQTWVHLWFVHLWFVHLSSCIAARLETVLPKLIGDDQKFLFCFVF